MLENEILHLVRQCWNASFEPGWSFFDSRLGDPFGTFLQIFTLYFWIILKNLTLGWLHIIITPLILSMTLINSVHPRTRFSFHNILLTMKSWKIKHIFLYDSLFHFSLLPYIILCENVAFCFINILCIIYYKLHAFEYLWGEKIALQIEKYFWYQHNLLTILFLALIANNEYYKHLLVVFSIHQTIIKLMKQRNRVWYKTYL